MMKWISVKDRLPPKDRIVLADFGDGILASVKWNYGLLGQPQQSHIDYRCLCCGRFGGMKRWAEIPETGDKSN